MDTALYRNKTFATEHALSGGALEDEAQERLQTSSFRINSESAAQSFSQALFRQQEAAVSGDRPSQASVGKAVFTASSEAADTLVRGWKVEGEKGSGPGEVAGGQSPEPGPSLGPGQPGCETLRSAHQHTPLPLTASCWVGLGGAPRSCLDLISQVPTVWPGPAAR